jgi:DNA-binding response OmpR family regulator
VDEDGNRRGRARLLLVEDDPIIARMYRSKLEHDGFSVQVAHDGRSGVRLALDDPPDLLLVDLRLPALDGHGLLARLRGERATRNLPVLVMTVYSDPELAVRSRELGAADHLDKANTTPAMLSARVSAVLDALRPGWRGRAWVRGAAGQPEG